MPAKIDIIGQRFGKLVVLEELPRPVDAEGNLLRDEKGKVPPIKYLCQCDCGNTCETLSGFLRGGDKTSCGCARKEYLASAKEHLADAREALKQAREARKQEKLAKKAIEEPRCPYPCKACKDSVKGLCCQDCGARSVCDNVCLNSPEKCGYKKAVAE